MGEWCPLDIMSGRKFDFHLRLIRGLEYGLFLADIVLNRISLVQCVFVFAGFHPGCRRNYLGLVITMIFLGESSQTLRVCLQSTTNSH